MAFKQSLSRLARSLEETPAQFPETGLSCYTTGVRGSLISFFLRNPDESFTWEDLLIRFQEQATEAGVAFAVRTGMQAGLFVAVVNSEFTLYPGPYINRVTLKGDRLDHPAQTDNQRMYNGSVQHTTVLRFKADPTLVIPLREVFTSSTRPSSILKFALSSNLLELFRGEDGLKYLRAGSALAAAHVSPYHSGSDKKTHKYVHEQEVLAKFVAGDVETFTLHDLGLTTANVLEKLPTLLRDQLVELMVGDNGASYLRSGSALPEYIARKELSYLEQLSTKLGDAKTWTGAVVRLTREENKTLADMLKVKVRLARKVLTSIVGGVS